MSVARATAIRAELDNDLLALGYAGTTDKEAADLMNAVPASLVIGQHRLVTSVETWRIIAATDISELGSLTVSERADYDLLISTSTLNPNDSNLRALFSAVFTNVNSPLTRAALGDLNKEPASRAEFLGWGTLSHTHIAEARALP